MNYRIVTFDELAAAAPEHYRPATRATHPTLERNKLRVADTQDDHLVLQDAILVNGGGLVWRDYWIVDTIHYMPDGWEGADWLPGQVDRTARTMRFREGALQPTATVEEPVLLTDCMCSGNFGHFIHDMAGYGLLYRTLRQQVPGLKPMIIPLRFDNQQRIFEQIFGIAAADCVHVRGTIALREVHVFRRQTFFNAGPWRMSYDGMRQAGERLRAQWGTPVGAGNDVFIHRRMDLSHAMQQGRDFTNVPQLAERLMDSGFIGLEVGHVGFDAVSWLLSHARRVLSIHGAGLANMIFCPPGCQIFEIMPRSGAWRSLEGMAMVLGLPHQGIGHPETPAGERPFLDIDLVFERMARTDEPAAAAPA